MNKIFKKIEDLLGYIINSNKKVYITDDLNDSYKDGYEVCNFNEKEIYESINNNDIKLLKIYLESNGFKEPKLFLKKNNIIVYYNDSDNTIYAIDLKTMKKAFLKKY